VAENKMRVKLLLIDELVEFRFVKKLIKRFHIFGIKKLMVSENFNKFLQKLVQMVLSEVLRRALLL
jgi:hypothetical protein